MLEFKHWLENWTSVLKGILFSVRRQIPNGPIFTFKQVRDEQEAIQIAKDLKNQYPQFLWTVRDEVTKENIPL